MNKTINAVMLFLICQTVTAQIPTTISYDSLKGYYLIRYMGAEGEVQTIFEPSTNINPVVRAQVVLDSIGKTFTYSYFVMNSVKSKQRLFSFSVEYLSAISNVSKPTAEWSAYPFSNQPLINWTHALMTPTGVKSRLTGIAPDSSLAGFSFRSSGLPGFVKTYSEGLARTPRFPEEPPGDLDSLLSPIQQFPHNSIEVITIGPRNPLDLKILAFLDSLISYKHQSLDLGWIKDQGIANSLDQKLDNAKAQLTKKDNTAAKNVLQAFVYEVEAQKDKHLTSEAYALLKFNAEYLISKLQ